MKFTTFALALVSLWGGAITACGVPAAKQTPAAPTAVSIGPAISSSTTASAPASPPTPAPAPSPAPSTPAPATTAAVVGEVAVVASSSASGINGDPVAHGTILPRARSCYRHGLQQDPTQHGDIVVRAAVTPQGGVDAAEVVSNTGLGAVPVEPSKNDDWSRGLSGPPKPGP